MIEGALVDCPHCGEPIELSVDTTIPEQSYYEDCPVCCQPMEVFVRAQSATAAEQQWFRVGILFLGK